MNKMLKVCWLLQSLVDYGYELVSGGTENHLVLVNLKNKVQEIYLSVNTFTELKSNFKNHQGILLLTIVMYFRSHISNKVEMYFRVSMALESKRYWKLFTLQLTKTLFLEMFQPWFLVALGWVEASLSPVFMWYLYKKLENCIKEKPSHKILQFWKNSSELSGESCWDDEFYCNQRKFVNSYLRIRYYLI